MQWYDITDEQHKKVSTGGNKLCKRFSQRISYSVQAHIALHNQRCPTLCGTKDEHAELRHANVQ